MAKPVRRVRVGRARRWILRFAVGAVLLAALGLSLGGDPTRRMLTRYGRLVAVAEAPEIPVTGGLVDREVRLTSSSGLVAELLVRRPVDGSRAQRPGVILLGGLRTGRGSAQLVTDTHGAVVVGVSYPTQVQRIERLAHALEARRAILDTPAALMLVLDYVSSLPYVDADRIELVGVSLGAPFVCVAGALDQRPCRIWSMYGGGAPARLIEQGLKRYVSLAPARRPVSWLIAALSNANKVAPEQWVAAIAPRPFVMVNATADERIPRECVELLYDSAAEPKEMLWIEGGHLDKHDLDQIRRLVNLVLTKLEPPAPRSR